MRYTRLSNELYIKNRIDFANKMKPSSVAIFHSNDIMPVSADSTMPFQQHRDIFHLSGVDQEESVLVLFPDSFQVNHKEILFLKETNATIAIWEGAKLDRKAAFEVSGVKTVYWLNDFDRVMKTIMGETTNLYLNSNEHTRANIEVETREARMNTEFSKKYPFHSIERSAPIMHRLRSVKNIQEINQMQKACDITKDGLNRILKYVKPGVMEYEIEAEFIHEFVRQGSKGFAYTPIVASGKNACVLHYIENDAVCNPGEVILMDVGAEYGNYAADMTRCIPVNGRFSERQLDIYNSVYRVMQSAMKLLKPGVFLHEYHKQVGELMTKELLDLKLITKHDIEKQDPNWPAYKKYFMHGTSHFIGLDTHDVGMWHEPIQAGNAFTVEPGIYILEEGIGIRLENDLIIQENGVLDLMKDIPLEAAHIEEIMNS